MKDIRPQLRDGDDQKAIIRKVNDFAEKLQVELDKALSELDRLKNLHP